MKHCNIKMYYDVWLNISYKVRSKEQSERLQLIDYRICGDYKVMTVSLFNKVIQVIFVTI